MYEFKLPDLGEGIHEGEILAWHVAAGQRIEEDAPLVDVETDKAAVTIPSPRGGIVVSVTGGKGDTVQVGQVLAVIDDGSGAAATAGDTEATGPVAVPVAAPPSRPAGAGPVPAAPATRRLARELGVDINQVPASGPAGRVTPEDVKRAVACEPESPAPQDQPATPATTAVRDAGVMAAGSASPIPFLDLEPLPDFSAWGPVEKEPLRSIRRRVAHKMVTSMVLVPHVAHLDEADVTELEELRRQEKECRQGQPGGRLTLLPFLVKAVTAGLREAPVFNASLDPFHQEIISKKYYNIGIAVDSDRGLIVPVVRDTDRKSVIEVSAQIEELAERARAGTIEVSQLRGGTFTITNVGAIGGTAVIPTINYPEVAILGLGRVQERPVVRDGEIVIRKMLPLTLAFDHRIADGAAAARFVSALVRRLSDPNKLLLEA